MKKHIVAASILLVIIISAIALWYLMKDYNKTFTVEYDGMFYHRSDSKVEPKQVKIKMTYKKEKLFENQYSGKATFTGSNLPDFPIFKNQGIFIIVETKDVYNRIRYSGVIENLEEENPVKYGGFSLTTDFKNMYIMIGSNSNQEIICAPARSLEGAEAIMKNIFGYGKN